MNNDIYKDWTEALPLTISDAMRIATTWSDLPKGRLQKLRTALATAARVLAPGQNPATAAASIAMNCESLTRPA
jgi:hypothetical protein